MEFLKVTEQQIHLGRVDDGIVTDLVQAVGSVPRDIFFDFKRQPLKTEVKGLDKKIAEELRKQGWMLDENLPL